MEGLTDFGSTNIFYLYTSKIPAALLGIQAPFNQPSYNEISIA